MESTPTQPAGDPPVVFYDGECGLCDGFVQWLLRRDPRGRLRYAPLQGETAHRILGPPEGDAGGWTVVLLRDGRRLERSDAVLAILAELGAPWSWLAPLRIVPRGLRDAVYRFVAARRYRWFGKRDACRMPRPEEAARFLP